MDLCLRCYIYCLISIGFAGCASIAPYSEPTNEPRAMLTVVAGLGTGLAGVFAQADTSCQTLKRIAAISEKPELVANLNSSSSYVKEKSIAIPVQEPFRFQISDLKVGALLQTCQVAAEFDPAPGFEYQVVWSHGLGQCNMKISRKKNDGHWETDPTTRQVKFCQY